MPTRSQWKFAEDRFARLFGTVRRPLSGGGSKTGRDDSMHPTLFLESKYAKYQPLFRLYRDTKKKAKAEGRVPVIGLQEKAVPGILLVIHSADLPAVIAEYAKANPALLADLLDAPADHQAGDVCDPAPRAPATSGSIVSLFPPEKSTVGRPGRPGRLIIKNAAGDVVRSGMETDTTPAGETDATQASPHRPRSISHRRRRVRVRRP